MSENQIGDDSELDRARQRIEACGKEGGKSLDLRMLGISSLPLEVYRLTSLTEFALRYNQLAALPHSFTANFSALTKLDIGINQLRVLPPNFGNLSALTHLDLHDNHLSSLPRDFGRLSALTELFLHDNRLRSLPPDFGSLSALTKLNLSDNRLRSLPSSFASLSALTSLNLSHNRLRFLPADFAKLTTLRELFLHGNPLGIPSSILGPTSNEVRHKGRLPARPADILAFYFRKTRVPRPLNQVKIMLVGRGGAGKTSLRRYFRGQPHSPREKETSGIALDPFDLHCAQGILKVRLWDFAGQEITHALHQFFLTEGCVYLLVLDPRSNTEMLDAESWLGLLQRYAGKSPVLIALNHQDDREGGYDVDRVALQERFPNIHSFTRTNCESRDGCDELKTRLREAVETIPDSEPPYLKVPKTWVDVMRICAAKAHPESGARRQVRLTLTEFCEICAQNGESDPSMQKTLARLLHKLGAVLHFIDEPRLRDTAVLDPHWVTDGVYRLLRYKDRPGSDGTLTLAEALEALTSGETDQSARFLLRLMERFEMCFPLDDAPADLPTKWLIPSALNPFQPEGVPMKAWQTAETVRMRYTYQPLPEGVLPRFIVLTQALSEEGPRWRRGVVLKDGSAMALVRRGANPQQVEISAIGPSADRLHLLEIVQGTFDRIHRDLPEPRPVAEIELEGRLGVYRRVEELQAAEELKTPLPLLTASGPVRVEPNLELNRTSDEAARTDGRTPLRAFLSYSHLNARDKRIFQLNLTSMQQRNLIDTWHDGRIDPGMLWKEEIRGALDHMDLFVGLLTTEFLASIYIRIELKAAHDRLAEQGRPFHFVLIEVDEHLDLEGLREAHYQLLSPGGKPVRAHKNLRTGFNLAEKELAKLCRKWQAEAAAKHEIRAREDVETSKGR